MEGMQGFVMLHHARTFDDEEYESSVAGGSSLVPKLGSCIADGDRIRPTRRAQRVPGVIALHHHRGTQIPLPTEISSNDMAPKGHASNVTPSAMLAEAVNSFTKAASLAVSPSCVLVAYLTTS